MVHQHIVRDRDNLPVHHYRFQFFSACSVTGSAAGIGLPFIFAKAVVIVGVNDGEFALCERDFSEGVPIPQPPIQKNNQNDGLYHPLRNMNDNVDNPLPPQEIRISKSEILNNIKTQKFKCSKQGIFENFDFGHSNLFRI